MFLNVLKYQLILRKPLLYTFMFLYYEQIDKRIGFKNMICVFVLVNVTFTNSKNK